MARVRYIKFIYSEKATKFCEIFNSLLSYVVPVKSKVKISQNFVAFWEYMNFNRKQICSNYRLLNGQTYFSPLYETVHSHLPYWLTIEHASQNEKNFRKFHQSERTGELSWKTLAHFTKDICLVVTPKCPKVNNWHQIFRLSYWT